MPYVTRDPAGRITEIHAEKTDAAQEELRPDDLALRQFLGTDAADALQSELIASDLGLIRVLEDLITVLIDKRIVMLTDLPQAAQRKLARRYDLRSKLSDLGGIVAESEEIILP